jgi:hypothetical protein
MHAADSPGKGIGRSVTVPRTLLGGTDNAFDRPSGAGLSGSLPRYFVPGYYQPVPPGQKPFTRRGLAVSSSLRQSFLAWIPASL